MHWQHSIQHAFQHALSTLGIGSILLIAPLRAETSPLVNAPAGEKTALQAKQLGKMRPVHALGDIYLTGQPAPEDLPLLEQEGIKTVITLRKANEVPWDEAAAVKQHGMKFVQVPFQAAEELKPQVFDEVLKVLRDKNRGPTVLHCGAANRVGAIWYAHRILDGKLSPDAALKEAKIVGLRTPAYLERAQAYVEKTQSEAPTADAKVAPVPPTRVRRDRQP